MWNPSRPDQEASNQAKTVIGGFFIHRGVVETVAAPKNGSNRPRGSNQGGGGDGKGAGSAGNSSGGEADLIAKKKKKKVGGVGEG